MPLNPKGRAIMKNMEKEYGEKKGKSVFYASKNKGTIKGVEAKSEALKKKKGGDNKKVYCQTCKSNHVPFEHTKKIETGY